VVGYNVYYSKNRGRDYVRTNDKLAAKATSLRIQLQNDQTYYFVITAVNAAGKESEFSSELGMTPYAPTRPVSPKKLASKVGARAVELTWAPAAGKQINGYNVYYSKASGQAYRKLSKAALLNEPRCLLKGLEPGIPYYFVVTCVDKNGLESEYSNEVEATPKESTVERGDPLRPNTPAKGRRSSLEEPF
jgi:fibronectin type 3 domain-containing protein